jgi:flagellin
VRGISINTNTSVLGGLGALGRSQLLMHRSMERLATGQRINRAADDPAGMMTAEQLNVEARTLSKRLENLDHETYYLGAKDGGHSVVADMLLDLQGLVQSASNTGANTKEEREAMQMEVDTILETIDYLGLTTVFNGEQVLGGMSSALLGQTRTREVSEDDPQEGYRSIADLRSGRGFNLVDGDFEKAAEAVDLAIKSVNGARSAFGSRLQAIDSEKNELSVRLENILDAKSRIMDTDYASETAEFVRSQALSAAAQFSVQFAMQQRASTVLSLLPVGKLQ